MIKAAKTDQAWKQWGEVDPYFGVMTEEKFRAGNLNDQSRQEFFQSGQQMVDHVLEMCRGHVRPDFDPKTVLDYGCGVGRMAISFARGAESVTGIDVSEGMLTEATANTKQMGADNVRLLRIEGSTLPVQEKFDLVHCYIVLQHIPPQHGLGIFQQLIDSIAPGGIGAIQMTYSRSKFASHNGLPPSRWSLKSLWRSLWVESPLRRKFKSWLGLPGSPEMQMNPYHLNQVFFLLQRAGVTDLHVEFTNHGGHLGTFLVFSKSC
ncbi:class I SAM-dependent methyltransferase [Blastopirellula marina]|nr:class I SAM-dependent methyltransferase [Blastopirellula marina]